MKLIPSKDNICSRYAEKMLVIKMNNHCNCSCSFCVDRGGFNADAININEIGKHAIELEEYENVFVTGGEPFLDFCSVIELLKLLKPYKKRLVLNTNGTLLNPYHVEALNGLLDELQISVHHWLESVNMQIFGCKQDLSSIKDALNCNRSFMVSINSTFNKFTKLQDRSVFIGKMVELCRYIGAKKLRITELKRVGASEFVSANDFFEYDSPALSRNSNELITQGCTYYFKLEGIDVCVKRLCDFAKGENASAFSCCFINDDGQKVIDVDTKDTFKVIYSDGRVRDAWIYSVDYNVPQN